MADLPTARVSDSERERVAGLLREHCVQGRLSLDEFSERVATALQAKTVADLERSMKDLPSTAVKTGPARRQARRRVVAFMSGADVKGRWRAADRMTFVAVMGGCKVDLRGAEIEGSLVRISAWAFWGGIHIIVPEGIEVEVGGMSIMGGRSMHLKDVTPVPGSPIVQIRAVPIMGGISVRSRPVRRSEKQQEQPAPGTDAGEAVIVGADGADAGDTGVGTTDASAAGAADSPLAASPLSSPVKDVPDGSEIVEDAGGTIRAQEILGPPEASGARAGPDGTVTILFSDICDYTGLTERLGDRRVQEILVEHRELVRKCVEAHGGREVKVHGDGFMLAFDGVARALRCAAEIQKSLARRAIDDPQLSVAAHMGLHTGEALTDGDDYAGHTVILARRLADVADAGEVLVSSVVVHMVARSREFTFGPLRELSLKGLKEPESTATFLWDGTGW